MIEYKISFKANPISLFPSYRPMYRIAQILLVLYLNSNGNKASLLKLHLFSWAFKSAKNLRELRDYVTSNFQKRILYFGIEPTLNRALNLAIGEGLITFDGSRYEITEKGFSLVADILKDTDLFSDLLPTLSIVGKRINEAKIGQLEKIWKNA